MYYTSRAKACQIIKKIFVTVHTKFFQENQDVKIGDLRFCAQSGIHGVKEYGLQGSMRTAHIASQAQRLRLVKTLPRPRSRRAVGSQAHRVSEKRGPCRMAQSPFSEEGDEKSKQ